MKTVPRFFSLFTLSLVTAHAEVQLPAIFSDHMVLQRDARVPVWGTAAPGEKVTVEFAGQTQAATTGPDGKWKVALAPLATTGEPRTLTVRGQNTIVIQDVLVGEVWLGSGQSNMAMTVNRAKDFAQEQAAADLPLIRHFKEESGAAASAQSEGKGRWVLCAPDAVGTFSAALYFFGREIHQTLRVPVGLINSSVGGTPIESWIDAGAQRANKELQEAVVAAEKEQAAAVSAEAKEKYANSVANWEKAAAKAKAAGKKAPKKPQDPTATQTRRGGPGGLFNGKIAPLVPYAIRGALWYQGEANGGPAKAPLYRHQLPLLVRDWRARWGEDFPFAWVQLPSFGRAGIDWPTVREAMLQTLALPKTGMAITIDVGEATNIHPQDKQSVGHRLALWALGTVYGQKVAAVSGPLPVGHQVRGREVFITFKHADGGLVARDGELKGFAIAGADRQWVPAQARIEGSTVAVSAAGVAAPVAVRYAWENLPTCNLFNGAGLPATPFRTDDWN